MCPTKGKHVQHKPIVKPPQLRTPGVISTNLGVPLHRVLYVLRTRHHIQPTARAGRLRLYDKQAVAMVRHELNSIDARRAGGGR